MPLIIKKGTTARIAHVFIEDTSKNDGSGLTGLVYNSTNLVCYRARTDDGNAGATAVSLATMTRGTWVTGGGFVEKDATNLPGVYEFSVPNAALLTGSDSVVFVFKGAANMAPTYLQIQLVDFDPDDSVHLGLTALPNALAGAAGGLLTLGNIRFQKNTAYSNFVFKMTDALDHVSPKTGLTVACQRSIDGGAFANCNTVTATEIASGWYKVALAAGDLNGDSIALKFTSTGADQLDIAIYPQVE